jgi:hypothetical protein
MGLRFSRHLGIPQTLDPQQWTDATASGRVALCCPKCSEVSELGPTSHVVSRHGRVTPAWRCPVGDCGFVEWLELEAFGESVLW